jgi:hypothetical protein
MSRRSCAVALTAATALATVAAVLATPAAGSAAAQSSNATAAAPELADGPATVVPVEDPHLTYMGQWGVTAGRAITVNSGSRLEFWFTGATLHLLFDTASITVPSQIYVSIDAKPRTLYKVDRDDVDVTPTPLAGDRHHVVIDVKDVDEYENRWVPPLESGVALTGLRLDPGAQVYGKPPLGGLRMSFFGDSITEGVAALCPETGVDCADGTVDYANLTGRAFHANFHQVGFGKQGIIQPGHGGVGTAAESFGWNYAGSPSDFRPDAVVVNEGTNDGGYPSEQFRPGYLEYLRKIRAANPEAWIFAMRPFGGYHADDIAWAVGEMRDDRIVYVDTTGWLSVEAGDFNGTAHPNIQGHVKAARLLVDVIEKVTGWRADPRAAGLDEREP